MGAPGRRGVGRPDRRADVLPGHEDAVSAVRAAAAAPVLIALRPVRPGEAETLFRLYRTTALAAYAHVFPPDRYPFPDEAVRAHWRETVARHGADAEVVVAEVDGHVAGAAVGAPGTLESMFVVPAQWGTGVADELHDAAVRVSVRAGRRRCRLEVLERNGRARRFYERHGWRLDGRSRVADYEPHPVVVGYSLSLRDRVA